MQTDEPRPTADDRRDLRADDDHVDVDEDVDGGPGVATTVLDAPGDREVVRAAARLANDLVDDLRPRLLAGSGSSRRRDKRDGSPVTDVDLAVDALVVEAIHEAFPDHGVVSEEGRTTWDGSTWTWIVDPIDGTTNYAAGLPWWCVSIGLAHRGRVVWGLVDSPPLDHRWEATVGQPTTCDGEPVRVAPAMDLDDRSSRHEPIAVTPGTIRRWQRGTFFKARVVGSSALELALVADGSLAAAYQRVPKAWDVAAGLALVTGAGGAIVAAEGDGHFPLRTDVEYRTADMVVAAGPDVAWCRDLAARLWPGNGG